MNLPLLLDSAMRSLALGFVAGALLKLARLTDTKTQTAVWTAVLVAALSMPLLTVLLPGWMLTLPGLPATPRAAAALSLLRAPRGETAGVSMSPAQTWLVLHGWTCLLTVYVLGLSACMLRLAVGLLVTLRLYARSTPIEEGWVAGRPIRASAAIQSPVSLAGTILVPADYREWSAAKRIAILAHEEAHIARRDFFVQLAALIHCALFWFSPFAWWLRKRLSEIAETASDEAAIRHLNDRATYAEILVEVSRRAQNSPLIVAMARSSFIEQRVEHILSDAQARGLSLTQRMVGIMLVATLAIAAASAQTTTVPVESMQPAMVAAATKRLANRMAMPAPPQGTVARATPPTRGIRAPDGSTRRAAPSRAENFDDETYDPRALLEPIHPSKPEYEPPSTIVHAGKEFYIRSSAAPVAEDVSVTYALERRSH
jgi:BlaR1 peptidase M56